MPRLQVIVLDKTDQNTYRYALWADVPAARQSFYANASKTSAWTGATAQDNANLQGGSVAEKVDTAQVPPGWTIAQVETELASRAAAYQTFVNGYNPWVHYGSTFDGTTWTVATVA